MTGTIALPCGLPAGRQTRNDDPLSEEPEATMKKLRQAGKRARPQVGAVPVRTGSDGTPEILLVTTRTTKRWTVPKGWPIKGLKAHQAAAREAREEAGVVGKIGKKPIGRYLYEKCTPERSITCRVKLFELAVKEQLETWPEREPARPAMGRIARSDPARE